MLQSIQPGELQQNIEATDKSACVRYGRFAGHLGHFGYVQFTCLWELVY